MAACGLTAPRNSAGLAELHGWDGWAKHSEVSLSIGPAVLHFLAAHMEDDPETANLLRGLDGVYIHVYDIENDTVRAAQGIRRMSRHLEKEGWQSVMLVHDQGEETRMLVKLDHGRIQGLTLLTADGESEAVVVNLMGAIKPENFSDIMVALEVKAPGTTDVRIAESLN